MRSQLEFRGVGTGQHHLGREDIPGRDLRSVRQRSGDPLHAALRTGRAARLPDAAAACARLLTGASLFAPLPGHVMCPMIMASAGRARVTGTYLGRACASRSSMAAAT